MTRLTSHRPTRRSTLVLWHFRGQAHAEDDDGDDGDEDDEQEVISGRPGDEATPAPAATTGSSK